MPRLERRASIRVIALLLLVAAAMNPARASARVDEVGRRVRVRLARLHGLVRVFAAEVAAGQASSAAAAARWEDFEQVVRAVVSPRVDDQTPSYEDFERASLGAGSPLVETDVDVLSRDATAFGLHGLGYSAREIADIVSGRISKAALDSAYHMRLAGRREPEVADYLDAAYRAHAAAAAPRRAIAPAARFRPRPGPAVLDRLAALYGSIHGVDPDLVRAVISAESSWNPDALSRRGAIGLMQLMPATARILGVNPRDPAQNVEGGTRYLSELLRRFKRTDLALVAYVAGPTFAERYAEGRTALYGEVRDYLRAVTGRAY